MKGFEIVGKSVQTLYGIKGKLKELKYKFQCVSERFITFDRYVADSNMSREELMARYHKTMKLDIADMRKSISEIQELLNTLESIIDTEYNEDNSDKERMA